MSAFPPRVAGEPSLKDAEIAWNSGDVATALANWQALAQKGDIIAANNLGYLYDNGTGVPKDPAKAAYWYRKVAEAGAPVGQLNLGNAYLYGRGVDKDLVEAVKWLTLAAAGGDAGRPQSPRRGRAAAHQGPARRGAISRDGVAA